MRFVVLLFGLLAILLTAFGGGVFFALDAFLTAMHDQQITVFDFMQTSPTGKSPGDSGLFCFIAAGYGLLGALMAFFRCGKQGALLLLIPVFGAALMNPYSLIFTGLQLLTALLAVFVGPLPINAPDAVDEE